MFLGPFSHVEHFVDLQWLWVLFQKVHVHLQLLRVDIKLVAYMNFILSNFNGILKSTKMRVC
jgi:hypothetical protein